MIKVNRAGFDRNSMLSDLLPDLTPLLDVFFMLVVFLILTASTSTRLFDLTIPEDTDDVTTQQNDTDTIEVTIFGNQQWAVDTLKLNELAKVKEHILSLHQSSPDKPFILVSAKDAPVERLMELLTFLRKHGVEAADIRME